MVLGCIHSVILRFLRAAFCIRRVSGVERRCVAALQATSGLTIERAVCNGLVASLAALTAAPRPERAGALRRAAGFRTVSKACRLPSSSLRISCAPGSTMGAKNRTPQKTDQTEDAYMFMGQSPGKFYRRPHRWATRDHSPMGARRLSLSRMPCRPLRVLQQVGPNPSVPEPVPKRVVRHFRRWRSRDPSAGRCPGSYYFATKSSMPSSLCASEFASDSSRGPMQCAKERQDV